MVNVGEEVGQKIRFYRRRKKMTIEELAALINKSKPTVSKYELGQVAIDIVTLYEIAEALGVHVEQLLWNPPAKTAITADENIPAFFQNLTQFYIYMYDGRSNNLQFCVVDVLARTASNAFKVMMYINVKAIETYHDCENTYFGRLVHYDTLSHLILENQDSPIEQVIITLLTPYLSTGEKFGLFFGLSTRPLFPCAAKALFSRKLLPQNDELIKKVMINREDIRLLKQYNMMAVL